MSDAQRIAKNTSVLMFAELITRSLSFFLVIIIARHLGDVGLGKYSFIFAFVGIFYIISDFGVSTLMARDIAKNKLLAKKYIDNVFAFKIFLSIFTIIIPLIIILFTDKSFDIRIGVLLAGISTSFNYLAYPFRNVFVAYEKHVYHAIYSTIERVIAFVLGATVLYLGYGLLNFLMVLVISNLISFVYSYVAVSKKFSKVGFEVDIAFLKKILKESLPFWFTMIFITFYFKIDTVMLGFMKGFQPTGWYNAAYKIIDALSAIPFIVVLAIYPAMSRFHKVQEKFLQLLYQKSFYYLFALGLPLAIGVTIIAYRLILFVYKGSFTNSAVALQILIWALVFIFVNYVMGYLLNSIGKQILFTYSTGFCALLNIALNFLLIPKYSYIGACFATVFTEFVNFLILFYMTSKSGYHLNLLSLLYKPVLASMPMVALLFYLKNLHLLVLVPSAIILYFVILFFIGGIGKEEVNLVKSVIEK
ncbi:MAG: flippase [Nanoarchaeota archaeon]|nr:flippase [Nanoarchaeota archaeon]